jgi:hypothetical protein
MTAPMTAAEILAMADELGPAKLAACLRWMLMHPEAGRDDVEPGHSLHDIFMAADSAEFARIDEIVQMACGESDPELDAEVERVAIATGLAGRNRIIEED